MDNFKMNRQLGTKWFTFYTKIRPWFVCIAVFTVIADFMQYQEVYTNYWWMMVYFLAALAQPVLCIMVSIKSDGDYEKFVRFVKGVLIFETINMAYSQAIQQYIKNGFDIGYALVVGIIILLLGYFIWYRLNMKYFKKRINVITTDALPDDSTRMTECKFCGYRDKNFFNTCPKCGKDVYSEEEKIINAEKIKFCRKCGEKLIEGSKFCCKCGTEIVETHND